MKIVILGAGQVGTTLAENLAGEANDVTVVDHDAGLLAALQERLELRTVQGYASHPATLRRAGGDDADLVIAVTESDETNLLACKVAATLFRTPTRIARIRNAAYLEDDARLLADAFAVDLCISPEQLVTEHILRLIEYPGALQVVDFADGRVRLVGVRAYYGGPLVSRQLKELPAHLPKGVEARVAAIYRRGRAILPEGDTIIEVEDEVFFVAAAEHIPKIIAELRRHDRPVKRVMLAGGGNIGLGLAKALEGRVQVKLIEKDPARARDLAAQLSHAVVLAGDAASESLLQQERVDETDVFCAITNDDEANILSSMLAKRLGAAKAYSLINRMAYVDLVEENSAVDIAISPQHSTVSALLARVRRGDVVKVHALRRGAAEAMEAVVHGDARTSKLVGRRIEEVKLPPGATIGAIVRGDEVIIVHHDTVIATGDHLVVFIVDKRRTREVEKFFQLGLGFF